MRCPSLATLPPPAPGRTGWPWTEESLRLPEENPAGQPWPRLTIVTPSFNHGRFLEETIRSILLQGYPNLEYFILDGGSTDHTVEIIEKYSSWVDFWVSEPDRGQSAAINRGLRMGSGALATWINSDDLLGQNALSCHFPAHEFSPGVIYIGDCLNIDEAGAVLSRHRGRVESLIDLVRVRSVWEKGGHLCQQEVLFPLDLAIRVGGLNEHNHYSMDYELWGELFLAGCQVRYTGIPFGVFRRHPHQKTQESSKQIESTLAVAAALIDRAASFPAETRAALLADLERYRQEYPDVLWRQSGRLSQLGLPRSLVAPLRGLRAAVEKTARNLLGSAK